MNALNDRLVYLVCYDICDPKRLQKVYKTMRGFGEHFQYSVFKCELDAKNKVRMITKLERIIDVAEDQVLIAPLGPATGRYASSIETIGRPLPDRPSGAVVV